jgi:hypothetical protein
MCHAAASTTERAIEAGGAWQCARCGQHWDAARLAAVAAYAVWDADRNRAAGQRTDGPVEAGAPTVVGLGPLE